MKENQFCKCVLLLVPVNAINNWENEFRIWIDQKNVPKLQVIILPDTKTARIEKIEEWLESGGILITSSNTFGSMCYNEKHPSNQDFYKNAFLNPGPQGDILYLLLNIITFSLITNPFIFLFYF